MIARSPARRGSSEARRAPFADRREAGRELAQRLVELRDEDPVVIALPRGGVPVAFEIATALDAPLDVLAVRKLGAPGHPELGIGAVAEDGTGVINQSTAAAVGVGQRELDSIVAREAAELRRRVQLYRGGLPPVDVEGRVVIVVDDGVATGVTDTAALSALRKRNPRKLVLAVPVCPSSSLPELGEHADEVICQRMPARMISVGHWYRDFTQVSDEEVMSLLGVADRPRGEQQEVVIPAGTAELAGDLHVPKDAHGLVLFAHGSGSSRRSPRNMEVARELNGRGLATLLFDLLTESESENRTNVFDIGLLCERLVAATRWARSRPELAHLPLGYFGASTGAAAALCAAAELQHTVGAIVSRGGRPDLAGLWLARVHAPTLLIVGSEDRQVLDLNRHAKARLGAPSELAVVKGAGHLFEEPGAMATVAELAGEWLDRSLALPEPVAR